MIFTWNQKWQRMFDQGVDVSMSTNGHYAVEIIPEKACNFDNHCLIFETDDDINLKHSKLLKLHKHFGDAYINHLKSLLNNTGILTNKISKSINEVSQGCAVCKTNKKLSPSYSWFTKSNGF